MAAIKRLSPRERQELIKAYELLTPKGQRTIKALMTIFPRRKPSLRKGA